MGVDRGYGSGSVNKTSPRAASAKLRKKGVKAAAKKYTSVTTSKAKSIAGSSEYVQRENAARAQLGTASVEARARQLPTAARAFTREMTGVDISRKGVKVDPFAVAMALPLGKVAKAAVVLKKAGRAAEAAALGSRLAAKAAGQGARTNRGVQLIGEMARLNSERVFKRSDAAQSGEFLGMNSREITAQLARNIGRAAGVSMDDIRKLSRATADTTTGFTKFSKKLKKRGGR